MYKNNIIETFWKSLCCLTILSITICCISYLFDKESFSSDFVKNIFSISFSILAPLMAVYLFKDWKEEHNKKIDSDFAKELFLCYSIVVKKCMNLKFYYQI